MGARPAVRLAGWIQSHGALLATLFLAAIIRVLGIASRPTWYDEAFAILFSQKGPAAMLYGTLTPTGHGAADIHPLGYYTVLWRWMGLFGDSLPSARSLSILAGLGTVLIAYALARSLTDRSTALLAAGVVGISPFQVHYSQEIRMYALLCFWLLLCTYIYRRASASSAWTWWIGFALCAALAQYTHNLAASYLVALAVWPLLRRHWRTLQRVIFASLLAMLLYLPWLLNLPAQLTKVSQSYWVQPPGIERLLGLPLAYVTNLPVPPALLGLALFAALGAIAIALLHMLARSNDDGPVAEASQWMLYLSFAPPLMLFAISQALPVYVERALIASGVTFLLWLAFQIASPQMATVVRWCLAGLLAIGFGIGIWQHVSYGGFPYAEYDSVAAELHANLEEGDVVVHSSKLSYLPVLYYDANLPAAYIGDAAGSNTDTLAPSTQRVLGAHVVNTMEEAAGSAPRVWFLIFDQSNQEYINAGQPRHPHLTWLLEHYELVETLHRDDLQVLLFVARSPR